MIEDLEKTKYRIKAKNMAPEDSGETLLMYIPEYFNDYTGTWTKIHKCIRNKKSEYFFDFDEARAACIQHSKKQPKVVWSKLL